MVAALARSGRELAKRLLLIQTGAVIFMATAMAALFNIEWGKASLVGGGIFIIANAAFALFAFMFSGALLAKLVAASFYIGEVFKIIITVVLFSVVFVYTQVELVPLMLTYLLVSGINIFAPVFFINNTK